MAKGYSARNGFGGGGGMMRQQQQMQQKIMKMQQDMAKAQEEAESASYAASVGGGVVQATVSGKKELTSLVIKPEAVDPEDVEMLQDLVISAVNEALRQADEAMENSMKGVTGGLNIPGLGL
ncbi:MAG: YbaB/EbfC family nucleoid-associated protein [Clostridiales bacterium]|nr:YbaB/EbfC family nucleoid-associated protein [Clostridiales bacterium]